MDLVHEVGGIAHSHERTPGVDIVLPSVQLLVALEREIYPFILGLEKETVRLKICPLDVGDIGEIDQALGLWRGLKNALARCSLGEQEHEKNKNGARSPA